MQRALWAVVLLVSWPAVALGQAVIVPSPVPSCTDGQALIWQASTSTFVCGTAIATGSTVIITDDTTTNATMYPTWVTNTTGSLPVKVSSSKVTFNPSTGTLTATAFSGPLTGNVTGKVTFRGKPVYTGSVIIVGKDGVAAAGPIETDGTYVVRKAPVGEVSVGVVSKDPVYLHKISVMRSSRTPVPASALRTPSNLERKKWFPIPKEYEEPVRSGLTFAVKKGDNQYDIELK